MSFGTFRTLQRKVEPPKPKLKTFDDLDAGSELVVVIDPTDSSQTITPEHNQLLTIESDATRRTFLFDRFNGKANPCAVCDVSQAGSEYKKRVCDHMMCVVNGVRGIEFVQSNGKWTPLNPLRRQSSATDSESRACQCPDGKTRVDASTSLTPSGALQPRLDASANATPSGASQPRLNADRRANWEAALRELDERSRAELVLADDLKRKAKRHEKNARLLRDKIFELLTGGSEKYESQTPLFDALKEFEDDQNEQPCKNQL